MIILFKYCADVENCDTFRDFGYIYIYIYIYIYETKEVVKANT